MKKMVFILVIIGMITTVVACKQKETKNEVNETPPHRVVELDYNKINYVTIKDLYVGLSRKEIEETYGEPIDSLGSGVSILVYMADEENLLVLNFDPSDKLSKVKTVDREDNEKIILE